MLDGGRTKVKAERSVQRAWLNNVQEHKILVASMNNAGMGVPLLFDLKQPPNVGDTSV